MWQFINTSQVSIVKHRDKPNTLLVRARTKTHIKEFVTEEFADRIFYLQNADYNYRAELTYDEVKKVVCQKIDEIDYFDFKGSIPKGGEYDAYYEACHDVWRVMDRFKRGYYERVGNQALSQEDK